MLLYMGIIRTIFDGSSPAWSECRISSIVFTCTSFLFEVGVTCSEEGVDPSDGFELVSLQATDTHLEDGGNKSTSSGRVSL
jgi:hypothetical protein